MLFIKSEDAKAYSGDGYTGMDYPSTDKTINFAVIKINGRTPKSGFQVNLEVKGLYYIIEGSGKLYLKDNDEVIEFKKGDVLQIDEQEWYAFEGDFEAAVTNAPAWTIEQHKYSEEN